MGGAVGGQRSEERSEEAKRIVENSSVKYLNVVGKAISAKLKFKSLSIPIIPIAPITPMAPIAPITPIIMSRVGRTGEEQENGIADVVFSDIDSAAAMGKFVALAAEDEKTCDLLLPKVKVLEMVQWLLRLTRDPKRTDSILGIFKACFKEDDSLNFHEFKLLYEEVATRVELQIYFQSKLQSRCLARNSTLSTENVLIITEGVMEMFARIWCSMSEVTEMRKQIVLLFEKNNIPCMSPSELSEIYDTMLITICQIRNVRKMFKALIEESGSGKLDKQDLLTLSASILRSFERSGVVVNDASRAAMQESIVAAYLERNDTVITIKHFTQLFDTFRRSKVRYVRMVPPTSSMKHPHKQARWKSALNLVADVFAAESLPVPSGFAGVDSLTKDKFDELDVECKGRLGKPMVLELVQWLFQRSPEQALLFAQEVELSWEPDDSLTYPEFCSAYSIIVATLEMRTSLEDALEELGDDSEQPFPRDKLPQLLNRVLLSSEKLECNAASRDDVIAQLIRCVPKTIHDSLNKKEVSDLFSEVCSITLMIRSIGARFKELDTEDTGILRGSQLLQMAEYLVSLAIQSISANSLRTKAEAINTRNYVLDKIDLESRATMSLGEMAFIHEEIHKMMRRERKVSKYRVEVKETIDQILKT